MKKQGEKKGSSAPQGTAVGSGSRPRGGKIPIATSSPSAPQAIRGSGSRKK